MSKLNFYVVFASIVAGISGILFGYDTGVISGALIFLKKDFVLSPSEEGLIVSLLLFGAAVGALVIGSVSDKLGRKKLLLIISLLFIITSFGISRSTSLSELYLYRFLLGISIGVSSFAAPSYISEIAPANMRGLLVSFFQTAIVIGILLTYVVNFFLANNDNAWRLMFVYGVVPATVLLFGLILLPESPRWLLSKSKESEAIKSLSKLRGNDNYANELNEIKAMVQLEHTKKNWNSLFTKMNMPLIAIAIIIMLFQQLSGINAIIYYAPKIFMYAGFDINNSLFGTVLVGVVNLISTLIGLVLLDKLGRRPLMIFGSLVMSLALLSVAFTLGENTSQLISYLGVASVLVYIFAFAISTGLFGWLIISEIFPLSIRGEGAAIGASANWIFNICVSYSFPLLLKSLGIATIFGFFSFVCFLSLIYCIFYLPETKGISLENIERNLLNGAKSRDLGKN